MEKIIYLPAIYIEKHHLPAQVKVQISNQHTSAILMAHPDKGAAKLSLALAKALSVPAYITWQYRWSPSSATIKLGPVVAVFCRRSIKSDSTNGTAGELNCLGRASNELPGIN